MSEKKADEKKKEIEEMKKKIPELEEIAFKNYHWVLLKAWLLFIILIPIGLILGIVVFHFIPVDISPLEPSKIEEIAKTLIAPSVTMNGLFIAFVPVISFFYIEEIKENQKDVKEGLQEEKKRFKENEDLKTIDYFFDLAFTLWHNIRSGVLKYTRTYLSVSILSLFYLVIFYVALSPIIFMLADACLLIIILTGVFPIINFALYKPTLKLRTYFIPERIVKKIEYED